jgi:hypothetical protein
VAVAADLRADGGSSAGAVTLSWLHNLAVGVTILVVDSNQSDGVMTGHGTTGVQWDSTGTPANLTRKARTLDNSTFCQCDIWYLVSPVAGNKTIAITNDSASIAIQGGSASYTGSDTATPFGASNTLTGAGPTTQPSLALASSAGDLMHDTVVVNTSPDTITAGGSQTQVSNDQVGTAHTGASSDKACVGASTTMSWAGTTTDWGYIAVVIKAASTATVSTPLPLGLKRTIPSDPIYRAQRNAAMYAYIPPTTPTTVRVPWHLFPPLKMRQPSRWRRRSSPARVT